MIDNDRLEEKVCVDLSEHYLIKIAQQQTGLKDFGCLDFLEGMRVLLKACNQEADLSLTGQRWLQNESIQLLSNRLQIEEIIKQHPEILDIPVDRPLFIVTLPRTGSTFMHHLLAQDTQARTLLFWELRQPVSLSNARANNNDLRIKLAETAAYKESALFPNQKSMHYIDARSPEECYYLLKNNFASFDTTFWYNIPSYHEWLCEIDLTASYRYYKKQLQILLWQQGGQPLILKNPGHLLGLSAILTVFPDANIVQLHRAPQESIASLCSLQMHYQNSLRNIPLTTDEIGTTVINRWLIPLEKSMQHYDNINPSQRYDIHYKKILTHPIEVVSSLYQHFNYNLSLETQNKMEQWLKNNLQNKHGKHHYDLKTFGLNREQVNSKFNDYIQKYKHFI